MNKIKQIALGVLLALTTAGSVSAEEIKSLPTFHANAELMVGNESTVLDAKTISAYDNVGLFTRNIVDVDHQGVNDFGLVDLTYNIGSGDLVLEGQYSLGEDAWFSPRVGIQGYTNVGDLNLYGLATLELGNVDSPTLFETVGKVSYAHDLGELDLDLSLEVLLDVGLDGISFAQEKARVGVGNDYVNIGAGVNLIEIPTEDGLQVYVNAGPYIKGSF